MTNPGNIVRVRARNGGRASVYEANGWAQAYTSGLVEGNGVLQNTVADMKVLVGGSTTKPDIVLATNPAGYKIALDLVGQQAITLTAPASNKRISSIVAYTDDLSLATTEDTVTGAPASCGLIVVNGTAAANPVEPTDAQIRTAITADGATGSQAAYCIIANVTITSSTSIITNDEIAMNIAQIGTARIADQAVTADKLDFTTLSGNYSTSEISTGYTWTDGKLIYKKTINFGAGPDNTTKSVNHNISNLDKVIKIEGYCVSAAGNYSTVPFVPSNATSLMDINVNTTSVRMSSGDNRSNWTFYVTLYYTKTS